MSSKETAEKIVAHLESRDPENRGLNGAFARMKRRDHKAVIEEIANILDGKPAREAKPGAPKPEAKPSKPEAPKSGGKAAQA